MINFRHKVRHYKQGILLVSLCMNLVFFSSQSSAVQLYRYKNDQGNLVMGQVIPPRYVSKGYDILNEQGRLIQRVAPALTPKQIAQRNAKLEQEKQAKIAQAAQDEIDAKLKQLYSHPDDAVRILERRIQDIKSVIQVKRGRIENTEKQILEQEELAANKQRKGFKIPDAVINKITVFKKDITNSQADILELNQDYQAVLVEFDKKIKRLEEINHTKSSKYTELLNSLKDDSTLKIFKQ